ncbi:hypothetical protein PoB_002017200 [Plakobranchus ocellatus]|uniref:Secreted protein n=1 Tax=Plakobranchus ocellatus TaxID=259542 RepID=A0AAV3ZGK5_9GAST|nr:hypothetical protein PoB_002017200 [Plakobranchus ocellatus]
MWNRVLLSASRTLLCMTETSFLPMMTMRSSDCCFLEVSQKYHSPGGRWRQASREMLQSQGERTDAVCQGFSGTWAQGHPVKGACQACLVDQLA